MDFVSYWICSHFYHKTLRLARGQYLKVDIISTSKKRFRALDIIISFFLSNFSNILLAVLHKFFVCFVRLSLWSMVIPRSFTSLLLFVFLFSAINMLLLFNYWWSEKYCLKFTWINIIQNQFGTICVSSDNFQWAS